MQSIDTLGRWVMAHFVPWRNTTEAGGSTRYRQMIPRLDNNGALANSYLPDPMTTTGDIEAGGMFVGQKHAAAAATALNDDATSTLTTAGRGLIYIVRASGNIHFLGFFSSAGVTEISDPDGVWAQADSDGSNCLFWSSGLVLRNRTGSAQTYYYHIFGDVSIV